MVHLVFAEYGGCCVAVPWANSAIVSEHNWPPHAHAIAIAMFLMSHRAATTVFATGIGQLLHTRVLQNLRLPCLKSIVEFDSANLFSVHAYHIVMTQSFMVHRARTNSRLGDPSQETVLTPATAAVMKLLHNWALEKKAKCSVTDPWLHKAIRAGCLLASLNEDLKKLLAWTIDAPGWPRT